MGVGQPLAAWSSAQFFFFFFFSNGLDGDPDCSADHVFQSGKLREKINL